MALTLVPAIIILIIGAFLLFVLDTFDSTGIIGGFYLAFIFAFFAANLNQLQATFYIILNIMYLIFRNVTHIEVNNAKQTFAGTTLKGVGLQVAYIMLGIGIFILMVALQSSQPAGASILGVPTLSVVGDVGANIKLLFTPLALFLFAAVEGRAFISVYLMQEQILARIPFLSAGPIPKILSGIMTALEFGVFHVTVYVLAFSAILYAAIIMAIWLLVYNFTKDLSPHDTAHGLWNVAFYIKKFGGLGI